jgi:hypothetical protein
MLAECWRIIVKIRQDLEKVKENLFNSPMLAECWPIIVKIRQDLEKVQLNLCISPVLAESWRIIGSRCSSSDDMPALANIGPTSFIYWIY